MEKTAKKQVTRPALQKDCQYSRDADGNAAHRALNFPDFKRFGGPERMTARAYGNAGCNRIIHAEQPDKRRCENRPCDSRHNDRRDRNGGFPCRWRDTSIAIGVVTDFGIREYVSTSSSRKSLHRPYTLPMDTSEPTALPIIMGRKFRFSSQTCR